MKILSLDGGGCWALIQARCLLDLFGDIGGHDLLRKFDLVIANSGGSIVLACLIEDMQLSAIISLFRNEQIRKEIFLKLSIWERNILLTIARTEGIGPKYKTIAKLDGLKKHLPDTGARYLSELPKIIGKPELQLMFCSFDYERNREVFFRSNMQSLADSYYYDLKINNNHDGKFSQVTLVNAVHSSTNAPVNYFDQPAAIGYEGDDFTRQFWDGAIGGYNNPVFAGVLEAMVNGTALSSMVVLSIGTGTNLLPLYKAQHPLPSDNLFLYRNDKSDFLTAVRKLATSILADPPDSASFHAYALLHPGLPPASDRFYRFSPVIKPVFKNNSWDIPINFSPEDFEKLIALDMDAIEDSEIQLIDKLCNEWMSLGGEIENQAVRANNHLECIIGFCDYTNAKKVFLSNFKPNE